MHLQADGSAGELARPKAAGRDSFTVSIARHGGFAGAVVVSVLNAPTGILATPLTIPAGKSSGKIALSAEATAAGGSVLLGISAGGKDVESRTTELSLTVFERIGFTVAFQAPIDALGFPSVTLSPGQSVTVPVVVTRRGGYTGTITLTPADQHDFDLSLASSVIDVAPGTTTATVTARSTAETRMHAFGVFSAAPLAASGLSFLHINVVPPN
jgi:hypothetical protein